MECVAAEKDSRDNARAEITGEVRGDSDIGEAPYHDGVGKADCEGGRGRGNERVGGVEDSPNDDTLEFLSKWDWAE